MNIQLTDELIADNHYMVHAGMNSNWGNEKVHEISEKRDCEELRPAGSLIDWILFLERLPTLSNIEKKYWGKSKFSNFQQYKSRYRRYQRRKGSDSTLCKYRL